MIPGASSMLASGGIGAALIAGWNQVKNFLSYVSSYVMVQADLDYTLAKAVRLYLKAEYKPLPSGLLTYISKKLPLKHNNRTAIIPFRIPNANALWYGKGHFVFVTGHKVLGLRFLVGFDRLIENSIKYLEHVSAKEGKKQTSRFYINRVIGMEKGAYANHSNGIAKGDTTAVDSAEPEGAENFDINLDKSFMYPQHDYLFTKTDDPLDGLYFDDDVLRYFEQARQWYEMGDWYSERKIPHRRGWLLEGPGGTGKSSICKAVAQILGIPIYQYFLATLSDREFLREWEQMSTPCVALFEDFDTIFNKREALTEHKSLTFDCVLNQISGVSAMNGVFLMVTTNHLENIDEAMGVSCGLDGISTRPGRIDSVIHVGMINRKNRLKMATRILKDWPEVIDTLVDSEQAQHVTPIQFQEMCIQYAFDRLALQDGPRSQIAVDVGTPIKDVFPG